MSELGKDFYVTGGSLRSDTPSYVERRADSQLYEALTNGEFCYILTARQMGKSSLMARTTARLRRSGVNVAILDLTAVGRNLTVEQWYFSLLGLLGEQLKIEPRLEQFWQRHERQGPLRRLIGALTAEVLDHFSGKVVVFVDEIDIVRSLPFNTDEFFAAIRECYNRRSDDARLERLTFCLLGCRLAIRPDLATLCLLHLILAAVSSFMDFTPDEASSLTGGFTQSVLSLDKSQVIDSADRSSGEKIDAICSSVGDRGDPRFAQVMQRILYWTGGHPYLTQRLCLETARYIQGSQDRTERCINSSDVNQICADLFFSHGASERDDNLVFVRERIIHDGQDPGGNSGSLQTRIVRKACSTQRNEWAGLPRWCSQVLYGPNAENFACVTGSMSVYSTEIGFSLTCRVQKVRRQRAAFRRGISIAGCNFIGDTYRDLHSGGLCDKVRTHSQLTATEKAESSHRYGQSKSGRSGSGARKRRCRSSVSADCGPERAACRKT